MLWVILTLCSCTFAQSDVDEGCENLTRDIGLLLSAGISDYAPKLESVFRRRTDESWRPDRVRNRVNLPQSNYEVSEIVEYRTIINDLLDNSSEKIRKLLFGADQGVTELRKTLLDVYRKKLPVTYNQTEVEKPIEKKYYYNAGYTNTPHENLEEEDPYASIRQNIESLALNKCFGDGQINVSFEQSTVHVPFNVYSLSDDVLTTAVYSTGLDKTFTENAKNSKVLSWQYFASSKGLTRFYPGLKWKLEDEIKRPIDYDARFESWYASSINYPKEIIIMVDSSGSMKGYRKVLAILTIRTIIDSLSDQDFFNVIHFESTPSYLHSCFERTLVRATDFNKQQFKERF
ncbi:Oidioi.mRNA.OKI2018_I69.XSR.g15348.t1.cds [Oikopleura dioica]|uniref:Oidioi.mRNA.OKI2018_I69.XSR.g15348.t1.cds n=1 Tax=Oikopleura dioica TaxID=34765 RepID=A0ABN7SGL7_OIKDI|nr:Oidioi.mRNA.OKI2018_I69.XSR.g15348.t1.cds [Oikopleura dioica]